MKNNIFKFLLSTIAIVIVFTACQKKLEEYNPSGLTASSVYTKAVGFETLVNAAYSYSRYWYGKEEGYQLSEMGTDIWTSGTGDVFPQVSQYNNLQGNNTGILDLEWNSFYAAINLCNTGITNIAAVSDYTATQKATREGELRFLRAFYNWHVVETWGGVQLTTIPSSGVITTASRTSVDSFYTQIFADLQFAVANLPLTSSDYGRATQPVAKAFLARMYLTRGQNAQAIALANDVIKNYGFSLLPAYSDLWDMGKLKNKEVVWAVDYSTNLALNDLASSTFPSGHSRGSNNGHLMFLMVYDQVNTSILIRDIPNGRPFNRYMPTLSFLNLFDDDNDGRYAASFQTVWRANKTATGFAIGDTAAFASKAVIPPATMASKKYTTYDQSKTYAANGVPVQRKFYVSLKKFKDSTRASLSEAQSARDAYVIRLAEMYLIAAEAEVNIGKTDSAAYYVNIIRTRAALPGKTAQMQVTPAQMNLDFILDERARELYWEGFRRTDLIRFNRFTEGTYLWPWKGDVKGGTGVADYKKLYPIPSADLSSNPNLVQNTGY